MNASDASGYGHFCMLAKTLERLGDRWTLLVVRDLTLGPKRFTDLMDRLAGITPKTLTRRLRDLEADGVVEVDRQAGRREVWYRLTPAGQELQPALDQLLLWGMRNVAERPGPDEPVHPEHVLRALEVQLRHDAIDVGTVRWSIHVPGVGTYTLTGDGTRWNLRSDDADTADVTLTAKRSALVRFLTLPPPRDPHADDVDITGKTAAIRTFLEAIEVFPPKSP